jgi:RNA polymerase sigma factor (sigma-70 family)
MAMFLKDRKIIIRAKQDKEFLGSILRSQEAIKFIKHVIKNYTKSPARFMAVNKVEWDDLQQAASIGLLLAIRKMNLDFSPNEWIRYSYLSIQGELRKFSRSNDSNMIVICTRIRELYPKYKKFHEKFWIENARDPSIEETMQYFDVSKNEAFELVYGMQEILSLQSKNDWQSPRNHVGRKQVKILHIQVHRQQSVDNEAINRCMSQIALSCVNEVQRKVIFLHYFKGFSKTEISRVIGCSNSMVAKHISTAMKNIREVKAFCY